MSPPLIVPGQPDKPPPPPERYRVGQPFTGDVKIFVDSSTHVVVFDVSEGVELHRAVRVPWAAVAKVAAGLLMHVIGQEVQFEKVTKGEPEA